MSVTAARGFRAAGVAAGLKPSGRPDVALVVNDGPDCAAAGVFTRNRVQAAPVLWTRQVLTGGRLRAVVLNSGGANACTGPEGFADTHATAEHVGAALGVGAGEVAVCSTGLIGVRLPMDQLLPGVTQAAVELSTTGGGAAAEAIRTTDTVAKQAVRTSPPAGSAAGVGAGAGGVVTVGGMGKGAAMLAPSLATMLVVVTTDAVADTATLDRVVREACRTTFERVDSDGCLSTNDTVLLLASGASGRSLPEAELTELVTAVCDDLAGQMLGDAEGSTKTISITVTGAASEPDALEVGRAIARNNLLKCALYGKDPNWG
ncbi:bifunctional glutamate N-acetyltransferase/amino-acid acetyltransferase ArgJ, partial [Frankia sp. EI5c]|uniref:bifunctional glutamate N-acetyltransferase/amino-acid acetyltransferase ArgJ n=1 Tax=Frankia sp. EI5c TaxID=683316 RepID=UPI001F5B5C83